jgi:predicted transposase YbfD/YdcC
LTCHGAGWAVCRHQATRTWTGAGVQKELAARGITVRSPSRRGIAEEAPDAYKSIDAVVEAAEIEATREIEGKETTARRYYILSQPLSAARFLDVVRAHWHVENRLHWVLDVVMDEDQARARKDHAPENLARLRRFALNIIRANNDKGSTRGKIKRVAWDDAFLLQLLARA